MVEESLDFSISLGVSFFLLILDLDPIHNIFKIISRIKICLGLWSTNKRNFLSETLSDVIDLFMK